MKIPTFSAILVGAGLVIAGPAIAQTTQEKIKPIHTAQRNDSSSSERSTGKGMNSDGTTGLSSAKKEREQAGAAPAGSNTGPATSTTSSMSHNDGTSGLSSAKKEREEAGASNR